MGKAAARRLFRNQARASGPYGRGVIRGAEMAAPKCGPVLPTAAPVSAPTTASQIVLVRSPRAAAGSLFLPPHARPALVQPEEPILGVPAQVFLEAPGPFRHERAHGAVAIAGHRHMDRLVEAQSRRLESRVELPAFRPTKYQR